MEKQKIKFKQFEVPNDFVGKFFSHIEDTDLNYSIIGYDADNEELIVDVDYTSDERDEVMNLIELLDEYKFR